MKQSGLVCLDMEGVLTPEIWINVAEVTGIEALRRTTRDEPNYDTLMQYRLAVLDKHNLTIKDIQGVISTLKPLPGAETFLTELRRRYPLVILSDTFYPFAGPLMEGLGLPTLFCHDLDIDDSGKITGYRLRLKDQKRLAVKAFKELNFKVAAAGDSYNDTTMLKEADHGFLFCPPQNVIDEFPQFPVNKDYGQLLEAIKSVLG